MTFSLQTRSLWALGIALSLAASSLAGCDDEGDDAAPVEERDASVTETGTTPPDGGSAPDTGAPEAGGPDAEVATPVRCTKADFDANDHTQNGVDISFPNDATPAQYINSCSRVKVGQHVGFYGDFSLHPLEPSGGDSPSFVPALTNSGPSLEVNPTTAGVFGFQCRKHPAMMYGAVEVVP